MGMPPTLAMVNAGVPMSLSLDTMAASDNSDMFNAMRVTMGIERARAGDGSVYQPAQVLRHATSEGAAILGFDRVGELREGWRADVILLRADDLNMAPINVLDGQVVLAAQPSNVDTVFIDGVLRKQHGELIGLEPKALARDATRAVRRSRSASARRSRSRAFSSRGPRTAPVWRSQPSAGARSQSVRPDDPHRQPATPG